MSDISIQVNGIDKLQAGLKNFRKEIRSGLQGAATEAAREVLNTVGLRRYPPATEANQPGRTGANGRRVGYYERGRGYWHPAKGGGYRNDGKSERYGTQFYHRPVGYGVVIGNRASYAEHLAGDNQSERMGKIGWRKLIDVAQEKLPQIVAVYNRWVERIIKQVGL